MTWQEVSSQTELRRLGKLKEVAARIEEDRPGEKIPKRSWEQLYIYVASQQATPKVAVDKKLGTDYFGGIISLEDLKALGTFREVKEKAATTKGIEVKGIKGWQQLYQAIKQQKLEAAIEPRAYSSLYFKDETSELIFYILELEGELRLKKLGINRRHFKDKNLANTWKNAAMKKIHPDNTKHQRAEEATKELNRLYRSMIEFAK